MSIPLAPSRASPRPELYIPLWLFPEERIFCCLEALDDEILQSIHLGRFAVSLRERELESAPRE